MASDDPCANPANEIVAENCLEGHPATEWDINGYGDPSIQGFGTDIAVARGESLDFKIDTDSDDYRIDIYRMGYYGGMGARRVASFEPSAALPQIQPDCLRGPIPVLAEGGGMATWPAPPVDCGNWAVSASWRAPADATSGIYFARLVREDPIKGWVKNDEFEATPLPPTGRDSLWEADGFRAVMRNALREPRGLERNGYDVSYSSGIDTLLPSAPDAATGVVTISGTASDSGGGVVAAVEVSLDGGTTWHPARGRAKWSFEWDPATTGDEVSILSRAVDDSGNLEMPGATLDAPNRPSP